MLMINITFLYLSLSKNLLKQYNKGTKLVLISNYNYHLSFQIGTSFPY